MIIKTATHKDANTISNLIQQVTYRNPNNYSPEQIHAWKKYNTPSEIKKQLYNRIIFCAFAAERIIGTIALQENYVLGFYVSDSFRNTGIGSKLLIHLEKYALSNNINTLKLTSTPSAVTFYSNRGFISKKKVVLSIFGIDYPEIEMEKIINCSNTYNGQE